MQRMKAGSVNSNLAGNDLVLSIDCYGQVYMCMIAITTSYACAEICRQVRARLVAERVNSADNDGHKNNRYYR